MTRKLTARALRNAILFARETWSDDGAEGETVHRLCDAIEELRADPCRCEHLDALEGGGVDPRSCPEHGYEAGVRQGLELAAAVAEREARIVPVLGPTGPTGPGENRLLRAARIIRELVLGIPWPPKGASVVAGGRTDMEAAILWLEAQNGRGDLPPGVLASELREAVSHGLHIRITRADSPKTRSTNMIKVGETISMGGASYPVAYVANAKRVIVRYDAGLLVLCDWSDADLSWDLSGVPATPEEETFIEANMPAVDSTGVTLVKDDTQ